MKGYLDYYAFVLFHFGYEYLDKLNLSQVYILRRWEQIEQQNERLTQIFDNMAATHPSKETNKHLKDIRNNIKIDPNYIEYSKEEIEKINKESSKPKVINRAEIKKQARQEMIEKGLLVSNN